MIASWEKCETAAADNSCLEGRADEINKLLALLRVRVRYTGASDH